MEIMVTVEVTEKCFDPISGQKRFTGSTVVACKCLSSKFFGAAWLRLQYISLALVLAIAVFFYLANN